MRIGIDIETRKHFILDNTPAQTSEGTSDVYWIVDADSNFWIDFKVGQRTCPLPDGSGCYLFFRDGGSIYTYHPELYDWGKPDNPVVKYRPLFNWFGQQIIHRVPDVKVDDGEVRATAAVKTLERMGYAWNGGRLWKPPIGPTPDFMDTDAPTAEAQEEVDMPRVFEMMARRLEEVLEENIRLNELNEQLSKPTMWSTSLGASEDEDAKNRTAARHFGNVDGAWPNAPGFKW